MLNIHCIKYTTTFLVASLLTILHSEGLLAMQDEDVSASSVTVVKVSQPVKLLADSDLTEKARDLAYWQRVLDVMGHQMTDFHSVENLGTVALKKINANGFGAALVVLDSEFEADASTNFMFPEIFLFEDLKKIAHGTAVAATAASKHPNANALATGATVYPVCSVVHKKKKEEIKLENDATAKSLFEESNSIFAKQDELLALSKTQRENSDFEGALKSLNDLSALKVRIVKISELVNECSENYREELEKLGYAPLNHEICDQLENVIAFCKSKQLEVPRVINMSLGFEAIRVDFKGVVHRLTTILQANDMLLVNSAGNDGKNILKDNTSTYESRINILAELENYPELLKHMLIVGAFEDFNNKPAEFSNRAGFLREQTLFALGFRINGLPTVDTNGIPIKDGVFVSGTSFASPRVAAMAVILHKYFPHLSMQEIKALLLRTAFKPAGYDASVFGQGGLNPLMAWIEALKSDPSLKDSRSLFSKFQGLFKKK